MMHLCFCGCGANTSRIYAPGHDARHVSNLLRLMDQANSDEDLRAYVAKEVLRLSYPLQDKFYKALNNRRMSSRREVLSNE